MDKHLSDYLYCNCSTVQAIYRACQDLQNGDTLCLGGGVIELDPEGAYEQYYCISNNDKGVKRIAFALQGKKNITIDGEGALLLFRGEILPFVVDGCESVTIRNLSIDYAAPFYAQAVIAEATTDRVVLQFDGGEFACRVQDGKLFFGCDETGYEEGLCLEFDADRKGPSAVLPTYFYYCGAPKDHGFLGGMYRDMEVKELAPNRIELRGHFGFSHTPGNYWICTYGRRDYPGFFVTGSANVAFEDIGLRHTQAMGIICQLSDNIRLERVRADLHPGGVRMLTVGADATHFVNCRGTIRIKDCKFVNMMDDACNIHGIYLKDPQKAGDHSFTTSYGHGQQEGINLFRPGDMAKLISMETLETIAEVTVESSAPEEEKKLRVVTEQPIPEIPAGCVVENLSTAPEIHISGTESGHNRPRGFLLSSAGRTLVENCKFYNMAYGISLGGEMLDWYESGPVQDVTIRNNDFCNSAFAYGVAIFAVPKIKNRETAGRFHGKVVIENNRFTMHEKRILRASNVGDLQFRDNTFIQDDRLPSHPQDNPTGFAITYCDNVQLELI